jgi:hypothetical protein
VKWREDSLAHYSEPFEIVASADRAGIPVLSSAGILCLVALILLAGTWRIRSS